MKKNNSRVRHKHDFMTRVRNGKCKAQIWELVVLIPQWYHKRTELKKGAWHIGPFERVVPNADNVRKAFVDFRDALEREGCVLNGSLDV